MGPKVVPREAFTVMGVSARCTPDTADVGAVGMDQLMSYHDCIQPLSTDKAYYGVWFETGEEGDLMAYFAGMAVPNVADVPESLVIREVPAAREAVCACPVKTSGESWEHSFEPWPPASPYEDDRPRARLTQDPICHSHARLS